MYLSPKISTSSAKFTINKPRIYEDLLDLKRQIKKPATLAAIIIFSNGRRVQLAEQLHWLCYVMRTFSSSSSFMTGCIWMFWRLGYQMALKGLASESPRNCAARIFIYFWCEGLRKLFQMNNVVIAVHHVAMRGKNVSNAAFRNMVWSANAVSIVFYLFSIFSPYFNLSMM